MFGSVNRRVFLDGYWERSPLVIGDRVREPLPLIELGDLETVLGAAGGLPAGEHGNVVAVRALGGQIREYPLRDGGGHLHTAAVYDAMAGGHTIVVNHVARFWRPAAEMCSMLEASLGHPVGCNLFLTPPGAVGFVPHYDAMDTLFVQVEGSKHWSVHRPVHELPFGSGFAKPDPAGLGRPELEATLHPGDVLFMPRGWIHGGVTTSEHSLHLTFGISPIRWKDLLGERARAEAGTSLKLRRAVPPDLLGVGRVDDLVAAAGAVLGSELPGESGGTGLARRVLESLFRRVVGRPSPLEPHFQHLLGLERLGLDTEVERRRGLPPVVLTDTDQARIGFPGSSVAGPPEAAAAFRFLARRSRFRIGDLPGPLDDGARLALARTGVRQGLLRPVVS